MAELKPKVDIFEIFKRSPHLKIYYFIGRLNPPHEGHIEALIQMINEAYANNSVALILLGSGPFEGERTMDNPIPFESKEDFLRYKLPEDPPYEIRQMTNPDENVLLWYRSILSHIEPPLSVEFIRYAGNKDGNLEKSNYMEKTLLKKVPTAKARGLAVNAKMANVATAHSASAIREFAYTQYLKDGTNGFANFDKEYNPLYGVFTRQMYNEILFPIQNEQLTPAQVREYIDDHNKKHYKLPMSDARRALAARKKAEKEAKNAAAKATVAASLGNAVTAKQEANELRESKQTTAKQKAKAATKVLSGATVSEEVPAATPKAPHRKTVSQGGRERKTRGGGTKKKRHRKTQKKLSNRK